jgi:hypothetical protein
VLLKLALLLAALSRATPEQAKEPKIFQHRKFINFKQNLKINTMKVAFTLLTTLVLALG